MAVSSFYPRDYRYFLPLTPEDVDQISLGCSLLLMGWILAPLGFFVQLVGK